MMQILNSNLWFVAGSLVGYICSQFIDVFLFYCIKNKCYEKNFRHKWIWNNISTIISQFFDTAIFLCIAFGLGQQYFWSFQKIIILLQILGSQYLIKVILALCDTPFFYLLTRGKINEFKIFNDN